MYKTSTLLSTICFPKHTSYPYADEFVKGFTLYLAYNPKKENFNPSFNLPNRW